MNNNRILRLVTGLVLLAVFLFVLISDIKHYSPEQVEPEQVTVTITVDVTDSIPVQTQETAVTESAEQTVEVTPTPEPTPALPDVDITGWEFILANATHSIEEYEPPELVTIEGQQFDSRIADAIQSFAAAARAEGYSVCLSSGYRDYATQSYLYNRKIGQGYTPEQAATIVAPPGTSEHQTGLVCDITDVYYETKNWETLEKTELYQWMSKHCQEYGFIVRYPKSKSGLNTEEAKTSVTGIIYEPWHFRYVGVEAATYIMENDLCLEEFLELYE